MKFVSIIALCCVILFNTTNAMIFTDIGISTVSTLEDIKEEVATKSVIEIDDTDPVFSKYARWKKRDTFVYVEKYKHKENQRIIFDACSKTDMDYLYFIALALTESSLREQAVGVNQTGTYAGSRDQGLFQINNLWQDGYAGKLVESYDVFNPYDNTIMAVNSQWKLFKNYHSYELCAIKHNKGASYDKPPEVYKEEPYVKKVMSYYDEVYNEYLKGVNYGIK